MMAVRKRKRDPAAGLSDDLIGEILARLPARPLCRFKCVSRSWRDLISGPVHRRRLAHADAASGFLYHVHATDGTWAPVTDLKFTALCPPDGGGGSPPPVLDQAFPFLPPSYTRTHTELLESCHGLLLLRCYDADNEQAAPHYIVCNPSTQDCIELPLPEPEPSHHIPPAALAFDPAVSSHFHVFELVVDENPELAIPHQYGYGPAVKAARIYSSETGSWVTRKSEWTYHVAYAGKHAYLDGFLHLATTDTENGVVASVDTKGQTWRATRVCPEPPAKLGAPGVIGQSQRRLLYVDAGSGYARELSVYALESCGGGGAERWILKHRAKSLDPSGKVWLGRHHSVVAVHPDCNVVFLFDGRRRSLIAYDMDRGTTRVVNTFTDALCKYRFFPYVPPYLLQ